MNRKELHKAAEEIIREDWEGKDPFRYAEFYTDETVTRLSIKDIAATMVAFHLHQTKKMLKGWTDEKLEDLMSLTFNSAKDPEHNEGARAILNELLKQLEE